MLELPNYSRQLMQQLWALRNGEHFCDCTVLVGDSPHRAHKLVLAASSMLFRSLLASSDTISIDTTVVSSEEFSCLLDMVYTGKLPLGKHNVTRIVAAADNLQMFDVAIGFKKVLSSIVNPKPSHSESTSQRLTEDNINKDSSDISIAQNEDVPTQKEVTKSASKQMSSVKKKKEEEQEHWEPEEPLKNTQEEAASEQDCDTVFKDLGQFSVLSELLNQMPRIRELLSQMAESSLDQQDRKVVLTCCERAEPDKVVEMLLSHVRKGVLSETALVRLLWALHQNSPATTTQLQSFLQELRTEPTGTGRLQEGPRAKGSEAEDTKEDDNNNNNTTEDCTEEGAEEQPSSPSSSTSSSSKKFTCHTCKRTFDYKCRLKAHVKCCSKSKKRPWHQCPQCPETLPSNQALMRHQIRVHNFPVKTKVECELCGRTFAHPSGLIYHMRSEHFEEKPFSCEECGAKFAANSSLKNHMRLHTGEKPYSCTECDQSFTAAAGLAYHVKKKHAQGKMYVCQYCKSEFAQSIELTRHVRTHTGDRPYVCRECGKGFTQAKGLSDHLQLAHRELRDCQKCCLSFPSLPEYQRHVHEAHPGDFHQCPECGRVFASLSLLNKHKATHAGSKLFTCDLCNKSYQLSGLWYHNRTTHSDVFSNHSRQLKALMQCDLCFKFFPSSESLAQHQAIDHQGSAGSSGSALRCSFCLALFSGPDWLQEHIQTHHVSELQDHRLREHQAPMEVVAEADALPEAADTLPEAADTLPEAADTLPEAADTLPEAAPSAADLVLSQSQSHLENAQQVFVALADGQEGAQVVEVSMFDLLNNSVTFVCEEGGAGSSS
ncbi:unnamed protein product [Knipowitschia caucasica]